MLLKSSIKEYKKHRIRYVQPISLAKEKIQRKRDTKSILLFSNQRIASKVVLKTTARIFFRFYEEGIPNLEEELLSFFLYAKLLSLA